MLIERNENKKEGVVLVAKTVSSPKHAAKPSKENLQHINTKDALLKSSKLPVTDSSPPCDDLVLIETNKIVSDYLKRILANELSKSPENFRTDFLAQHRFGWDIRARMVTSTGRLDDRSALQFQLRQEHILCCYRHHGQLFESHNGLL